MKKAFLKEILFPIIITIIFLFLSIILIIHHELWFDEVRAWVIGASSNSLKEFVNYMRDSEGHPYTWSALLYFIYHFVTNKVEIIKILHLIISVSSCFLFLKFAPFNKIVKTIFVFGYFPFYEYSIISRNYALGILLIFIFCILYKEKYKNIIPLAITLFLIGQANIFSFVISIVLFLMLVSDSIIDRKEIFNTKFKFSFSFLILLFLGSAVFLFWQLGSQAIQGSTWGPSLSTLFNKSSSEVTQSIYSASSCIISAILPLPEIKINFWGSNFILSEILNFNKTAIILLALILLILPILSIRKRKILFYILGIILILLIPIFIPMGKLRHYGHVFIFIIAILWISENEKRDEYLLDKEKFLKTFLNTFLITILLVSLSGSFIAFYMDFRYPFSVQKQVSQYIKNNFNLEDTIIAGYKDVDSTVVASYLNQKIYYPQTDEYSLISSYSKRVTDLTADEVFLKLLSLGISNKKILLILNDKLIKDNSIPEKYFFKKIDADFGQSIVGYEDTGLYFFNKENIKLLKIIDNNDLKKMELFNCSLSDNNENIIFKSKDSKLKLFRIPIKIEDNKNYVINFEIKENISLTEPVYADFYTESYDNSSQEFFLKPEDIKSGSFNSISRVINSGIIPKNKNIFLRIFTYSSGEVEIKNINVYKIIAITDS